MNYTKKVLYMREYNKRPEVVERRKLWRPSEEKRMALRLYCKQYRVVHKRTLLSKKLQKLYGITIECYEQLKINQNNQCLICENELGKGRDIAIDHDHKTGKVRGILCGNCNKGIGFLKENVQFLKNAIIYLQS